MSDLVLKTERLVLRHLTTSDPDAAFILDLLNQPSFIDNIGDRGVRDLESARGYISKSAVGSYKTHGFGLYLVQEKDTGAHAGICGLIKREGLSDVDVGFAFLPKFWSKGYAYESAMAVMAHGRKNFGLGTIVAITSKKNTASIKVLNKIGLRFEKMLNLRDGEDPVMLFSPDGT